MLFDSSATFNNNNNYYRGNIHFCEVLLEVTAMNQCEPHSKTLQLVPSEGQEK